MNQGSLQPASPERRSSGPLRVVILIGLTLPTVITYIYFDLLSDQPAVVQTLGMLGGKTIQFGLPLYWLFFIRNDRPNWKTGLDGSMLGTGLFSGMLILAAAMALYWGGLKDTELLRIASVEINQRVQEMGLHSRIGFIGLGIFYVLLHSLMEEYYWRWFMFGMLRSTVPVGAAMWISSLGFMAHHVLVLARYFGWANPATYLFSACVAVGGLLWSWMYHRSGKLYGIWLSHALVDAVIFVIGYQLLTF